MTREIARHLAHSGTHVIILSVSASPRTRYPRAKVEDRLLGYEFDQELARQSVEIIRVPQHPLHWRLDGLRVRYELKRLLKDRRVGVVLSYFAEGGFLPSLLRSRDTRFGYIATTQSYDWALGQRHRDRSAVGRISSWLDDRYVVRPYRCADIVFATSHFTRSELTDVLGVDPDRITVCYLGVDPAFSEIPREKPREMTQFIFFGRIVPSKGFRDAIKALGILTQRGYRNWEYRIFGSGMGEVARKVAEENALGGQVVVGDPLDGQGLRRELQKAHVAIMPSHRESFGLSIAEAQAAGIPVIAYDAGSVPEIVDNATGWLAPLHDVDRLADCIEEAIRNPDEAYRRGCAGRNKVKKLFTWNATAETMLRAIDAIL